MGQGPQIVWIIGAAWGVAALELQRIEAPGPAVVHRVGLFRPGAFRSHRLYCRDNDPPGIFAI